jgi:hypothetical protein
VDELSTLDDTDPALRLGRPSGYRYVLPGNWLELEPSPARGAAGIRRAVEQRVRRFPQLAGHRRVLQRVLREALNRAIAGKALRLALLSEPVGDGVVTASLTLTLGVGLPLGPGRYTVDPDLVAAYLEHRPLAGQVDDGARTVGLVPLLQQRAVRTRANLAAPGENGGVAVAAHGVEYLVPVPGTVQLLTLAFVTPCVEVAEPLVGLFDTIAGTFYWEWDGDEGLPGLFDV